MTECQGQSSLDEACRCLAKTAAKWGATPSSPSMAECRVMEPRGKEAQLVEVWAKAAESDSFIPGRSVVLVARNGETWSPLQVVEVSTDVDLDETPQATNTIKINKYEELPYRGGTLIWVQTQTQSSEWSTGEQELTGDAGLTLCSVASDQGTRCSARLAIATWDFTLVPDRNGSQDKCQVREATSYRVALESSGALAIVLGSGADTNALVGRYRF
jgi:hypothetical protein